MENTPQFSVDQVVVMQQVSGMEIGPLDGRLGNVRDVRPAGEGLEYFIAYDSGNGVVEQTWFPEAALLATESY